MSAKLDITIYGGVSLGPNACSLIAGPRGATDDADPKMAILRWSQDAGFRGFAVNQPLTRIESLNDGLGTVLCSTPMGSVCVASGEELRSETICEENGPAAHGYICGLRRVGRFVYAAGMGRQVYRRIAPARWERCDDGVLHQGDDFLDIRGFTSIDGGSEKDLWAVGHRGEVWHLVSGGWSPSDSPTNLLLYGVRVAGEQVWVCGQGGLLLRGERGAWHVVHQDIEPEDFVSIECFLGSTYAVGARHGVPAADVRGAS